MSPTGAAPNRCHLYLYLPIGHVNVVRYDDFSSNFRFWYPELASIIDIYFTLLTLSMLRGTDGSFQPAPNMTIVLFVVTALPCQVGL